MPVFLNSMIWSNGTIFNIAIHCLFAHFTSSFDVNALEAMVLKTTTPNATTGNPQPQISILPDGILNSVGLANTSDVLIN